MVKVMDETPEVIEQLEKDGFEHQPSDQEKGVNHVHLLAVEAEMSRKKVVILIQGYTAKLWVNHSTTPKTDPEIAQQ